MSRLEGRRKLILVMAVLGIVVAGVGVYAFVDRNPDRALVTVIDEDGTELGTVNVSIADTASERYTGLSDTNTLGDDEGMLFVHEVEGGKAYVMRDMAFPIDIVFIDGDRRITAIHHARPEEPPYTRYTGRAKWVLEVPYNWTAAHGVDVGDRVRIDWRGS